jgi:hypothetical protein
LKLSCRNENASITKVNLKITLLFTCQVKLLLITLKISGRGESGVQNQARKSLFLEAVAVVINSDFATSFPFFVSQNQILIPSSNKQRRINKLKVSCEHVETGRLFQEMAILEQNVKRFIAPENILFCCMKRNTL